MYAVNKETDDYDLDEFSNLEAAVVVGVGLSERPGDLLARQRPAVLLNKVYWLKLGLWILSPFKLKNKTQNIDNKNKRGEGGGGSYALKYGIL